MPVCRRTCSTLIIAGLLIGVSGCARFGRNQYTSVNSDPFLVAEGLPEDGGDRDIVGRVRLDDFRAESATSRAAAQVAAAQSGPSLSDFLAADSRKDGRVGGDSLDADRVDLSRIKPGDKTTSGAGVAVRDEFAEWAAQQQPRIIQTAGDSGTAAAQPVQQIAATRQPVFGDEQAEPLIERTAQTSSSEMRPSALSPQENPFVALERDATLPQPFPGSPPYARDPNTQDPVEDFRNAAGWRPSNFQYP